MEGIFSAGFLFLGSTLLLCFSDDLLFIIAALVAAGTAIYLLWAFVGPIISRLDPDEKNESEGENDGNP